VSRLDGSMVREARLRASPATHVLLSPTVSHNRTTERSASLRTPHCDNSGNRQGNPGSGTGSVNDRPRPRFLPSRTIPLFKAVAEYSFSRNCRWHLNHANSLPELRASIAQPQTVELVNFSTDEQ
jgi:hypothetical protein